MMAEPVFRHETGLGWDPVIRIAFRIPFISYEEEIREETDEHVIKGTVTAGFGNTRRTEVFVTPVKPVVTRNEDWLSTRHISRNRSGSISTPENMEKAYGRFRRAAKQRLRRKTACQRILLTPRFPDGK